MHLCFIQDEKDELWLHKKNSKFVLFFSVNPGPIFGAALTEAFL
jgi:hypothetical protein